MTFRLDDLLEHKKQPTPILDLSKAKVRTKEDFEKYFHRVPDYKVKPLKVSDEEMVVNDGNFSFHPSRQEILQSQGEPSLKVKFPQSQTEGVQEGYSFLNPIPVAMQNLQLKDLSTIDIDWRMLTLIRPESKREEEIFDRIVQLSKLKFQSRKSEGHHKFALSQETKMKKSRRAVSRDARVPTCKECGVEQCQGACRMHHYEEFERQEREEKSNKKEETLHAQFKLLQKATSLKLSTGKAGHRSGGHRKKGKGKRKRN